MTKRESIMILTPWPGLFSMAGGGTPRGRDLIDTLLAAGYDVDFVAPRTDGPGWFPKHDGFRVHQFRPPRISSAGYAGRWLIWLERTTRLLACAMRASNREGRPRVIYAWSSLAVPAAVICGAMLRRPTIGALFGTFLYPHLGRRLELASHFEESVAFKSPVDRLLVLNDGTRGDDVARAFGVPDTRLRFWMHGLDFESCTEAMNSDARVELDLPADVPLVVSASRLVAWKRVDRLVRAAPAVLAEHPDALFVISGEGPERPALESLAQELSIEHAVRFLGALPRQANLHLIASADVFCALADYSCVGVGLLEALGSAVAVVVADTGATREFVEDGVNGLVVSPHDVLATAGAIGRLLREHDVRMRLARSARALAEERFLTRQQRASLELETIAELASRR